MTFSLPYRGRSLSLGLAMPPLPNLRSNLSSACSRTTTERLLFPPAIRIRPFGRTSIGETAFPAVEPQLDGPVTSERTVEAAVRHQAHELTIKPWAGDQESACGVDADRTPATRVLQWIAGAGCRSVLPESRVNSPVGKDPQHLFQAAAVALSEKIETVPRKG